MSKVHICVCVCVCVYLIMNHQHDTRTHKQSSAAETLCEKTDLVAETGIALTHTQKDPRLWLTCSGGGSANPTLACCQRRAECLFAEGSFFRPSCSASVMSSAIPPLRRSQPLACLRLLQSCQSGQVQGRLSDSLCAFAVLSPLQLLDFFFLLSTCCPLLFSHLSSLFLFCSPCFFYSAPVALHC